jgi:1,2-diacylglycerol 3-alpha-glucosyltransferase
MRQTTIPEHLNICLIARKFPILSRAADHGYLWPIAKGLAAQGHNVVVLAAESPQKKAEIIQDGVQAHYLCKTGKYTNQKNFRKLVEQKFISFHQQKPFHIVHSIDESGLSIGKHKKEYKIAMAYDVEATQMAQLFSIIGLSENTMDSIFKTGIATAYKFLTTFYGSDRGLLNSADGVFVTSPRQRIVLERYYLYPDQKIHTVPYGIDFRDLTPKVQDDNLKLKLELPKDAKAVVTISDMTDTSEMEGLFEAFEKVAIKKSQARLIVIGNGPKRKEIERAMLDLALGNRVIFTGAIPNSEIASHISLADVFVNLSIRSTGFEPSMLEAMAQKKVIIGSEESAMSIIVEDGFDGFLIRPADTSALTDLLLDCFSGKIASFEIGDRARRKITNLFDTQKMVDETLKSYAQILRQKGRFWN